MDVQCVLCGLQEENQEHLHWSCSISKQIWVKIFDWWGLTIKFKSVSDGCYWNWVGFCQNSDVKIGRSIAIAATLWLVWLCRNLKVFENKIYKEEDIVLLIKQRSLIWWSVGNDSHIMDGNLWHLNPSRVLSSKIILINDEEDNERDHVLYGYTDVAFKMSSDGTIFSGLSGLTKDPQGNLVFIFSGPCYASSSFHAELAAVDFLMRVVEKRDKRLPKIRLHMDSVEVFNPLLRIKAGLVQNLDLVDSSFE
ncbi:hypothetical protein POM88_012617 [Heracleum sosnowskyi]|uniref:RNase H type-1 domain-containing protein n=1 Tax=Heracleum sosnowskyi TaxID=360622 RepID=A0AAD8IXQ7_9APIA|nr:hypothetical protein POM88_012617 [Heracleum sosnowskyi]